MAAPMHLDAAREKVVSKTERDSGIAWVFLYFSFFVFFLSSFLMEHLPNVLQVSLIVLSHFPPPTPTHSVVSLR